MLGSIFPVWSDGIGWNLSKIFNHFVFLTDCKKKNLALSFSKMSGPRSPYELAYLRTIVHLSAPPPTVLHETWNEMGRSRVWASSSCWCEVGSGVRRVKFFNFHKGKETNGKSV